MGEWELHRENLRHDSLRLSTIDLDYSGVASLATRPGCLLTVWNIFPPAISLAHRKGLGTRPREKKSTLCRLVWAERDSAPPTRLGISGHAFHKAPFVLWAGAANPFYKWFCVNSYHTKICRRSTSSACFPPRLHVREDTRVFAFKSQGERDGGWVAFCPMEWLAVARVFRA